MYAAAQLFARQGYHGTSTREIARFAEISENTLFRYFDHKEEIFWAALRSRLVGFTLSRELFEDIAESAAPEIVVPQFLAQLVDTAILKPELFRLIAIAFLELNWKGDAVCRKHFSSFFTPLNHYLTMCIESGKVRNLDPAIVMSAFAMTVMVPPEFSAWINGTAPAHSDIKRAVQAYTEFWLEVLVIPKFDRAKTATKIGKARRI